MRLAVAGLIGLAIGIEREWSGHASGPRARFAGVRTFFMLGLISGMAGGLALDLPVLAVVLLAGCALLASAAYVIGSLQTGGRDGTTEVAALLVLATGTLAGLGNASVAAGVAAGSPQPGWPFSRLLRVSS